MEGNEMKEKTLIKTMKSLVFALALLAALSPAAVAAWNFIGNVTGWGYDLDAGTVTFVCGQPRVMLEVCADDLIRVRLAPSGSFMPDENFVVIKYDWTGSSFSVVDGGDFVEVKTAGITAKVNKAPLYIQFLDDRGNLINQDHPVYRMAWEGDRVSCWKYMTSTDRFYGFGEKFTSPLDKRGRSFDLWCKDAFASQGNDTYVECPFFISPVNRYAIYFHNTGRVVFKLGTEDPGRYSFESPIGELDYYFFHNPDPKKIIERFTELTGRPSLPPGWVFGNMCIQSGHSGGTDIVNTASGWRATDIPVDAMGIDEGWATCYNSFVWDPATYPDSSGMCASLNAAHMKAFVWETAFTNSCGPFHDTAVQKNYYVKQADGVTDYEISWWMGDGYYCDFTSTAAVVAWQNMHYPILDNGINAFKTDDGEFIPNDALFSNGMTGARMHNVYPMLYNSKVWEATKNRNGRGFILCRAGYTGSQRCPIIWGGDQLCTWDYMKSMVGVGIAMGVSGFSLWTHDVPGAFGQVTSELLVRWAAELGVFLPFTLFNDYLEAGAMTPWDFDRDIQDIFVRNLRLRYRLLPYLYTNCYNATQTGLPMIRALFLEFPDDLNAYRDYQYLLGEDLLVAPVYEQGKTSWDVYLPEGEWTHYFTRQKYAGGQSVSVSAPLGDIPLFVRGGAIIPMGPEMKYIGELPCDPLMLDIYPCGTSSFTLYEDDGATVDYASGVFCKTAYTCAENENEIVFSIAERNGSFVPSARSYMLKFNHAESAPGDVMKDSLGMTGYPSLSELNSHASGYFYASASDTIYVRLPDSGSATTVEIINQAGGPAKLLCAANPSYIMSDGASTSLITAKVCDESGKTVTTAANSVLFSISGQGTLVDTTSGNASSGTATVIMKSTSSPGTAVVSATSDGMAPGTVCVVTSSTTPSFSILLTASQLAIPADGMSTSLVTALIRDVNGNMVVTASNSIDFSLGGAGAVLTGTSRRTAANGIATILLRSSLTEGTAAVSATSQGLSGASVKIYAVSAPPYRIDLQTIPAGTMKVISSDGTAEIDIQAQLTDINHRPVSYSGTLSLEARRGGRVVTTASTQTDGTAVFNDVRLPGYGYYVIEVKCEGLVSGFINLGVLSDFKTAAAVFSYPGKYTSAGVTVPPGTFAEEAFVGITEGMPDYAQNVTGADAKWMEFLPDSIFDFTLRSFSDEELDADFGSKVTLSISYRDDDSDGIVDGSRTGAEDLQMYYLKFREYELHGNRAKTDFEWVMMEGAVLDTAGKKITLSVNHFSTYALKAKTASPSIGYIFNYPNPFNPDNGGTVIAFLLYANAGEWKLTVNTSSGRIIWMRDSSAMGAMPSGYNEMAWDGRDNAGNALSNGVYFYKLFIGEGTGKISGYGKAVIAR